MGSAANTIILNAQGWSNTLNGSTPNAFYVAPVRPAAATSTFLYYNATSKEVTYGPAASGSIPSGASTGDYLVWDAAVGAWTVGNTSVELGSGANATGLSTVAVGEGSSATGDYGVAVGAGASTEGCGGSLTRCVSSISKRVHRHRPRSIGVVRLGSRRARTPNPDIYV